MCVQQICRAWCDLTLELHKSWVHLLCFASPFGTFPFIWFVDPRASGNLTIFEKCSRTNQVSFIHANNYYFPGNFCNAVVLNLDNSLLKAALFPPSIWRWVLLQVGKQIPFEKTNQTNKMQVDPWGGCLIFKWAHVSEVPHSNESCLALTALKQLSVFQMSCLKVQIFWRLMMQLALSRTTWLPCCVTWRSHSCLSRMLPAGDILTAETRAGILTCKR